MKKFLKNLYQKLQNTKTHLWSHITVLIGWAYLLTIIAIVSTFNEIISYCLLILLVSITIILTIPSIILILIEYIFFRKFKIKWAFLTKNPFYNIFWFVGQINFIIWAFITILVFGKNILLYLF